MRSGNGAPEGSRKAMHNQPPEYGPGHPVWELAKQTALALEGDLVKVTGAELESGHEGSPERLVVEMDVEIPLDWQVAKPFRAGSLGSDTVTVTKLRVKYSTDMTRVLAIELHNSSLNVHITQKAIDDHGEELTDIATRTRRAFLDHISKS